LSRGRNWVGPGLAPGLALGVVLVIGGCGDASEQNQGPPSAGWLTVGNVTMPTTPPALQAAMDRIDRAGRGEFADSFAGLEVDQERVRAIVYRVPSEAFDDAVRQAAGHACIEVRDAPHSIDDLSAWHDRVLADLQFWTHRGIRIVSIGARHDGSGVEVGTTDVEKTRRELTARYGDRAPLIVVKQAPVRPM
jgi:hypothetical protein